MGADLYIQSQLRHEDDRGYFRDSYNHWNLLWRFGLSWWQDVLPRLDDHQRLAVKDASALLKQLEHRQSIFEQSIRAENAENQAFFRQRRDKLKSFLTAAIELDEPIRCSL